MFAELSPGDFVCCGTNEFTPHLLISLFCVLGSSNFWRSPKNDCTSGHIIILIGDVCACVRVSKLEFVCLDCIFRGCHMLTPLITIMYANLYFDIF